MSKSSISVAIIDANRLRAAVLYEGLHAAGIEAVEIISETHNLLWRIKALDPDVVIIDLGNPRRDVVEQMFQVSRAVARPVAMFVDQSDAGMMAAAIDAGISAYVVDGLTKERVKSIVDLAITRFNAYSRLQDELETARNALADRKVIDRAKGILMRAHGVSEDEAYTMLRKSAMNSNRKVAEIAHSVVTAAGLMGQK